MPPPPFDPAVDLVPVPEQDRAQWDHAAIAEATRLLERAVAHRPARQNQHLAWN
ncbi:DUF6596 domain-containing protein [Actinomadura sp. NPDC049753]|uniref:DUF6596 domain-containing protein n=1 Tax=Actinomadura sp. NPDC049753 TaxID=3154739 RepID=UPI00341917D1